MSLGKVLNEHFSGLWKSFSCPTDTIDDYDNILWLNDDYPSKEEIQAKIAELTAAEPLRLLRLERDRLIQQTDWEIQRNTERNIDSTELITYRNALRDLPQEIESGNISAPTLDDQGNLIFDNWPERNLVNGEPS
jgi:hypothetical protein